MTDIAIEALVEFVTRPDAQEMMDAGYYICTNCGTVVNRSHCHSPCNGGRMDDDAIAAAKARMYEKYAHKRFTVTDEVDGHCWGIMQGSALTMGRYESCLYCGMMRPSGKSPAPCQPQQITLR